MTIYLQPFCEPCFGRYAMDQPFVVGGHEYATDGCIAVRVPTDKPDSVPPDDRRFPAVQSVGWDHSLWNGVWQPWPEPDYDGLGKLTDLDGDPESDFHHPASESDFHHPASSVATIAMPGVLNQPLFIALGYDILVRAFLPQPQYVCDYADSRVLIRFDGGEAILMTLTE